MSVSEIVGMCEAVCLCVCLCRHRDDSLTGQILKTSRLLIRGEGQRVSV